MEQITFTTSAGTAIINDCDTSSMNGEWNKLWLNEFDGNSQKANTDTISCIGIPGQRLINSTLAAKSITAKIGFAPLYRSLNAIQCAGERGKFELRRKLLKMLPLGEIGELNYKNSYGEYRIKARLSEVPRVSYTAGAWAEATLNFVADYPYWTYPISESEEIALTAGVPGIIAPTVHGDINSPIEVVIKCTEDITANAYERRLKVAMADKIDVYLQGINCYTDILAGTTIKYDIGTNGALACYELSTGGSWVSTPKYWSIQSYERNVCVNSALEPIAILINSGAATAKIIYHNIVTAI